MVPIFSDVDWPLNASRGLSAKAEFLLSHATLGAYKVDCHMITFVFVANTYCKDHTLLEDR